MSERVEPIGTAVAWNAGEPSAVLMSNDFGRSVLALAPADDDDDARSVVLMWDGVRIAGLGDPNGEARAGHRLYPVGLADLRGVGVVQESSLIAALEKQNSAQPFHEPEWFAGMVHHIVPLKECTAEVVAATLSVIRVPGSTAVAAASALAAESAPTVLPSVV
jgi:hypothetical protein